MSSQVDGQKEKLRKCGHELKINRSGFVWAENLHFIYVRGYFGQKTLKIGGGVGRIAIVIKCLRAFEQLM